MSPEVLAIIKDFGPLTIVMAAIVAIVWRLQPVMMKWLDDRRQGREAEIAAMNDRTAAERDQTAEMKRQREQGDKLTTTISVLTSAVDLVTDRLRDQGTMQTNFRTAFDDAIRTMTERADQNRKALALIDANVKSVPDEMERKLTPEIATVREQIRADLAQLHTEIMQTVNRMPSADVIAQVIEASFERGAISIAERLEAAIRRSAPEPGESATAPEPEIHESRQE